MDAHELKRLFEAVRAGGVMPDDAVQRVRTAPLEEVGGFALVDLHRPLRCGFPEVIFGQGKSAEQITAILQTLLRNAQGGLVTRVGEETAFHLQRTFPEGDYNAVGRTFRV